MAAARGELESDDAEWGIDRDDLPLQALALDLLAPQPDRCRLAKNDVGQPGSQLGRRNYGKERTGAVLLHLHRNVEHLERSSRVQTIHGDAKNLRVHVV